MQIFCARSNCSLSGDQTQLEIGTTSILTIAIVKITVSTKWGENYDLSFSQNNEKVVLVVARRKGNYASSQSTAITGQRDETDGAVPGPQTSGKVTSVHLLLLGWSFIFARNFVKVNKNTCKTFVLAQVSHARSKSAPATHQKGSESDTDGRRQSASPQHWSPCRSNIHLVREWWASGWLLWHRESRRRWGRSV